MKTSLTKAQSLPLIVLAQRRQRMVADASKAIQEVDDATRNYIEMLAREYGLPTGPEIRYNVVEAQDGAMELTAILPEPVEEGEKDEPVAEESAPGDLRDP